MCHAYVSQGCQVNPDSYSCLPAGLLSRAATKCSTTLGPKSIPLCMYGSAKEGEGMLNGNLPRLTAYAMTFIIINIFWQLHHRVFERAPEKLNIFVIIGEI